MGATALLAALGWHAVREVPAAPTRERRRRRTRVAWLCAGLSLALFGALAWGLYRDGAQVAFDDALAGSLAQHAWPAWLRLWALLTVAGDRNLLIVLGACVLAVLLLRRRWADALVWVAGTAGAGVLNIVLKAAFARARPQHGHGYAHAEGWSFPSGHATGAMAFYVMLAYLLVRRAPPGWQGAMVTGTAMLVAAVGYSRIVLQVHYFSDVVAAFAVTFAWLVLCMAARAWACRRAAQG
ncbi:phosphatase PAP2 family protein [Orrella sp. JC864]|uniref:phosphatase PAP2 family protein n=1 Tax=Orrella sp. JC864 TaxID=3120298 RepID=UPI00300BF13B